MMSVRETTREPVWLRFLNADLSGRQELKKWLREAAGQGDAYDSVLDDPEQGPRLLAQLRRDQELLRGLMTGEADLRTWWIVFNDPQLDSLIERAAAQKGDFPRTGPSPPGSCPQAVETHQPGKGDWHRSPMGRNLMGCGP